MTTHQPASAMDMDVEDSEKYQAKELKEHIFDTPDTYIGSTESDVVEGLWLCEWDTTKEDSKPRLFQKDARINKGLYKIADEILVNAMDQVTRTRMSGAECITRVIQVSYNPETHEISVYNDGDGLPVADHTEYKRPIPEIVFGQLLTSGNYKKDEKRIVGGKNGYGAKLANIFSTVFTVETVDHRRQRKYVQTWRNNMEDPEKPAKITSCKRKPYTRITFRPDYKRFGFGQDATDATDETDAAGDSVNATYDEGLTPDDLALLCKRVVDLAGCTPPDVRVMWNGRRVPCKGFLQYSKLFLGEDPGRVVSESPSERWEVVVAPSPDGSFKQMSFVNGVWTIQGGKHVDHVALSIAKNVAGLLNNKKGSKGSGGGTIQTRHVKNGMWLFIRCNIENPSFDSQVKETLTTPTGKFGSRCVLSEKFFESVARTDIAHQALQHRDFHTTAAVSKSDGRRVSKITGIPKLEDANWAGTKRSMECTLILTEGDSAKAMVMSGISVVGTDRFGVYPLRGKMNNLNEASEVEAEKKKAIKELKKIIGLKMGGRAGDLSQLRYGRIIFMTDQDLDGTHIKGLLINIFGTYWMDMLLQRRIVTLVTPLVRITLKKTKKFVTEFYSRRTYEEWCEATKASEGHAALKNKYNIKYYKGLGTSTKEEAKHYLKHPRITVFTCDTQADREALSLAFDKSLADRRKAWLEDVPEQPDDYFERDVVCVHDFVNQELVHHGKEANARCIPSWDGLKPSLRKVLYACLKRNITKEHKVSQLTGIISQMTAYHHGETSLASTIVTMAQTFMGSNNVTFLDDIGQFGSRSMGGKDASQDRYINSALTPIARIVFHPDDDALWVEQEDDGVKIEPAYLLPTVPPCVFRHSRGIGVGYSTNLPCYNPRDVVHEVLAVLQQIENGQSLSVRELTPWYRKFKGRVEVAPDGRSFKTYGVWEQTGPKSLRITELPVGVWTTPYKKHLEMLSTVEDADSAKDTKTSGRKRKRTTGASGASASGATEGEATDNKVNDDESPAKPQPPLIASITTGDKTHDDENIDFRITFNQPVTMDDKMMRTLKLVSNRDGSFRNMHHFDPFGRIGKYRNLEDAITRFVCFRLPFYASRRDFMLRRIDRSLRVKRNTLRFIQEIMAEEFHLFRASDEALMEQFTSRKYDPMRGEDKVEPRLPPEEVLRRCWECDTSCSQWAPSDDHDVSNTRPLERKDFQYLLDIKAHCFTAEKLASLEREIATAEKDYNSILQKTSFDWWREDLDNFLQAWDAILYRDAHPIDADAV